MLAGSYTVAELIDLLAAKDVEVKALDDAFAAFLARMGATGDTSEDTDTTWNIDSAALHARYAAARTDAQLAIALAELQPLANDMIAADPQYHEVLTSLQKTSGVVSPGDFQDLWNRLTSMQNAPIPTPPVPQPSQGSDVDLQVYNSGAATGAEKAVNATVTAAKSAAASVAKNWWIPALAVGAGAVLALKVLKPL